MDTESKDLAQQLFQSIDSKDADAFMTFLADDVVFRFGNAEPVKGKTAVVEAVKGFFSSINDLHHELERVWNEEDALVCHGFATYTRHDQSTLRVPFANVLMLRDGLITDYYIFNDTSELYRDA